jgi:hypothetical protein
MVIKTPPSHFNAAEPKQKKHQSPQFIDTDNSTPHLGSGQGFFHYLNTLFYSKILSIKQSMPITIAFEEGRIGPRLTGYKAIGCRALWANNC